MTITTVGYDLYPKSFLGKLIGGKTIREGPLSELRTLSFKGFCALSGVFIMTLPIPGGF